MKSTESDVCYFEVYAVFNGEPVELLEESTWTAGLRRTGNISKLQKAQKLIARVVAHATILAMSSDTEERMWRRARI